MHVARFDFTASFRFDPWAKKVHHLAVRDALFSLAKMLHIGKRVVVPTPGRSSDVGMTELFSEWVYIRVAQPEFVYQACQGIDGPTRGDCFIAGIEALNKLDALAAMIERDCPRRIDLFRPELAVVR